jgi:hypothetical protein
MGTNRVISAPVSALRAVFTGVGRIVMVADRPQNAPGHAGNGVQWRSLDLTGNVRLLSADDLDDGRVAVIQETPPEVQPSTEPRAEVEVEPEVEVEVEPEDVAVQLPLDNYDNLTLPSIRARLRGLDVEQLRVLAAYERTHAERPEVLGMFERRIERLETGP